MSYVLHTGMLSVCGLVDESLLQIYIFNHMEIGHFTELILHSTVCKNDLAFQLFEEITGRGPGDFQIEFS